MPYRTVLSLVLFVSFQALAEGDLTERARRRGQKGNPVSVLMSRTDIGDYLGLTTETVSRTITQLKGDGTIRLLSGGKVEIADLAALQELAEGA